MCDETPEPDEAVYMDMPDICGMNIDPANAAGTNLAQYTGQSGGQSAGSR
jgi:hypothetical protein